MTTRDFKFVGRQFITEGSQVVSIIDTFYCESDARVRIRIIDQHDLKVANYNIPLPTKWEEGMEKDASMIFWVDTKRPSDYAEHN